jgi:hypothetical protein
MPKMGYIYMFSKVISKKLIWIEIEGAGMAPKRPLEAAGKDINR